MRSRVSFRQRLRDEVAAGRGFVIQEYIKQYSTYTQEYVLFEGRYAGCWSLQRRGKSYTTLYRELSTPYSMKALNDLAAGTRTALKLPGCMDSAPSHLRFASKQKKYLYSAMLHSEIQKRKLDSFKSTHFHCIVEYAALMTEERRCFFLNQIATANIQCIKWLNIMSIINPKQLSIEKRLKVAKVFENDTLDPEQLASALFCARDVAYRQAFVQIIREYLTLGQKTSSVKQQIEKLITLRRLQFKPKNSGNASAVLLSVADICYSSFYRINESLERIRNAALFDDDNAKVPDSVISSRPIAGFKNVRDWGSDYALLLKDLLGVSSFNVQVCRKLVPAWASRAPLIPELFGDITQKPATLKNLRDYLSSPERWPTLPNGGINLQVVEGLRPYPPYLVATNLRTAILRLQSINRDIHRTYYVMKDTSDSGLDCHYFELYNSAVLDLFIAYINAWEKVHKESYYFSEKDKKELLDFLDNLMYDYIKVKFPLHQLLPTNAYLHKIDIAERATASINDTFMLLLKSKTNEDYSEFQEEKKHVVFKMSKKEVEELAVALNLRSLTIKQLVLPSDFSDEGQKMQHCIASYSRVETAVFFSINLSQKDSVVDFPSTLMISIPTTILDRNNVTIIHRRQRVNILNGTVTIALPMIPCITQHYFEQNREIPSTSPHHQVAKFLLEKVINWWFKDDYALVKVD